MCVLRAITLIDYDILLIIKTINSVLFQFFALKLISFYAFFSYLDITDHLEVK